MNAKWTIPLVLAAGIAGVAAVAGERSDARLVNDAGQARLTLQQAATIGEAYGKGRALKAKLEDGGKVWEVTVAPNDGKRPQKLQLDAFGGLLIDEASR